jgi:MoaA/NifB/PqqE/SkfB family radical SAM enzyme
MNLFYKKNFENILHHLYINPLEKCNLRCQICYTKKTDSVLTNPQITNFINNYQKVQKLETITFCGGEVFKLVDFIDLINSLTRKNLIVQIITNGTIDKLKKIENPNSVNLIVSIDGLEKFHNQNRGSGNYQKSVDFTKKAHKLGFHTEIFSIVTKQNFSDIDNFEKEIEIELGYKIDITYHPRKPLSYLGKHPVSNVVGQVSGFDFLTENQIKFLMKTKKTFPPEKLGCYQVALMSDGNVNGCCEGITKLGSIDDPIDLLIKNFKKRLEIWDKVNPNLKCLGCVEPEFVCGMKQIFI